MDTMSASDAKTEFSTLLDKVQTEPVIITKHGKPVAIVMSPVDFDTRLNAKREEPGDSDQPACPIRSSPTSVNDS